MTLYELQALADRVRAALDAVEPGSGARFNRLSGHAATHYAERVLGEKIEGGNIVSTLVRIAEVAERKARETA